MSSSRIAPAVAALWLALSGSAAGGLILHQTLERDRAGNTNSAAHTVFIKGHRQKVESEDAIQIYDLDRKLLVDIDKERKSYREIPFAKLAGSSSAATYRKTGESRVVAGYKCALWEVQHAGNADIKELACYSEAAPGTIEATEFNRLMVREVASASHRRLKLPPAGVVLLSEATTEMPALRVPEGASAEQQQQVRDFLAQHPEASGGEMVIRLRTESVESADIPDRTFAPPDGYKKIPAARRPRKRKPKRARGY